MFSKLLILYVLSWLSYTRSGSLIGYHVLHLKSKQKRAITIVNSSYCSSISGPFFVLHCHFFRMKSLYLQLPLTTKLFYFYYKRVIKTFFLVGKGMMNSALSVMP